MSSTGDPLAAFNRALKFTLQWEGGYSNHPLDRGGETNRGITQPVYAAWRGKNRLPRRSVGFITDSEVRSIYEQEYWETARCGLLPERLAVVHFDTAVNSGTGRATKFLQQALGVPVTKRFDPLTVQAVKMCDPQQTLTKYLDLKESFYRALGARPSQKVFLKGWLNRLNALRKEVS